MRNRSTRSAAVAAVAGAALAVAGCHRYEPRALDLGAHDGAWRARSPASDEVRAFADRLVAEGAARAGAFDAGDGLSADEGEIVALVFNPDLRLARLRAGVAAASAEHAGLWDDPQFEIDLLRITESVSNPWVITPGLAITLPISGRLEAEKSRADAAAQAALVRVTEEEWRVRRDVRLAWLEWSAARLRHDEQRALLDALRSLAASTARLAEAGEMLRTEAALFALERSQREYELVRMRGRTAEAEQRLRALLGLAPAAPVELIPSFSPGAMDSASGEISERNPTLARLRREYEVAEQSLRREVRKQYPDLTIGPLYETDQGQSRIGFLGAIPIPVLNANKQGIAEAEAEREVARAAFETQYERTVGAFAAVSARAESLGAERAAIVAEMVPLVDRQMADARRLLELGESGGLVLLESLGRAHDTKLHLIDVRLDEASALAELAFLSGPAPSAPPPGSGDVAPEATEEVKP